MVQRPRIDSNRGSKSHFESPRFKIYIYIYTVYIYIYIFPLDAPRWGWPPVKSSGFKGWSSSFWFFECSREVRSLEKSMNTFSQNGDLRSCKLNASSPAFICFMVLDLEVFVEDFLSHVSKENIPNRQRAPRLGIRTSQDLKIVDLETISNKKETYPI